jgi:hypothetical protein
MKDRLTVRIEHLGQFWVVFLNNEKYGEYHYRREARVVARQLRVNDGNPQDSA